jgi:hypothetical protein
VNERSGSGGFCTSDCRKFRLTWRRLCQLIDSGCEAPSSGVEVCVNESTCNFLDFIWSYHITITSWDRAPRWSNHYHLHESRELRASRTSARQRRKIRIPINQLSGLSYRDWGGKLCFQVTEGYLGEGALRPHGMIAGMYAVMEYVVHTDLRFTDCSFTMRTDNPVPELFGSELPIQL